MQSHTPIQKSISRKAPKLESQNFAILRKKGLAELIRLCGSLWTDHNLHDPGVTILELWAFALTELSLKADQEIPFLLSEQEIQALPTSDHLEISIPITQGDIQTTLSDLPEIRKAWINEKMSLRPSVYLQKEEQNIRDSRLTFDITDQFVPPKGVFESLLEFEKTKLNGNIIYQATKIPQSAPENNYWMAVVFPYWDSVETLWQDEFAIQAINLDTAGLSYNSVEQLYTTGLSVEIYGRNEVLDLAVVVRLIPFQYAPFDPVNPVDPTPELENILTDSTENGIVAAFHKNILEINQIVQRVRRELFVSRNICEAFFDIKSVRYQEVAVQATIELLPGVNILPVLAKMFDRINRLFRKKEAAWGEIHNNTTNDILVIQASEVIQAIIDVDQSEGTNAESPILSVRDLSLQSYINNFPIHEREPNCINIVNFPRFKAHLSVPKSRISLVQDGKFQFFDPQAVWDIFHQIQSSQSRLEEALNLQTPAFETSKPEKPTGLTFYSIQHDLPPIYGVGTGQLPANTDTNRVAQARQLKGYLLLLDQLLANASAQTKQPGSLFSLATEPTPDRELIGTQITHPVYDVPEVKPLIEAFQSWPDGDWKQFTADTNNAYRLALKQAWEDDGQAIQNRNEKLDHLLARYGLDMRNYESLQSNLFAINRPADLDADMHWKAVARRIIRDKNRLLRHFPHLSRARMHASLFVYEDVQDTEPQSPPGREHVKFIKNEVGADLYTWFIGVIDEQAQPEYGLASLGMVSDETVGRSYRLAFYKENYTTRPDPNDSTKFQYVLNDGPDSETVIAQSVEPSFDSEEEAREALDAWFAYLIQGVWNTPHVSGLEALLAMKLGFTDFKRKDLWINDIESEEEKTLEGMYMMDTISLRPKFTYTDESLLLPTIDPQAHELRDPYAFQLLFVFPDEPERSAQGWGLESDRQVFRLGEGAMKTLVLTEIRENCPAHIIPRILWLAGGELGEFQRRYREWLMLDRYFSLETPDDPVLMQSLIRLIKFLNWEDYDTETPETAREWQYV